MWLWRSGFVNNGGRVRVRGGSWRDGNKISQSVVECNHQFHLRITSCMSVCCNITVGNGLDTGEGGKTLVSGWLPTFNLVASTGQYFVSRVAAN